MLKFLARIAMALGLFVVLAMGSPAKSAVTASSGSANPLRPLLSCPNLDASPDNKVLVGDIIAVITHFGKDYGQPGYSYLFDPVSPYNKDNPTGTGQIRVADILYVIGKYAQFCPLVDTEVAKASWWGIQNVPQTEDGTALGNLGYLKGGGDAPGQGVHYVKLANWDANFNPAAPEGLVYDDGRLAAMLYVVNGDIAGWLEDPGPNQGPCWDGIDNGNDGLTDAADASDCGVGNPIGPPLDDVNIDPITHNCTGAIVSTECSWNGPEGWHLHYRLCRYHFGTASAAALVLPSAQGAAECQDRQNSTFCSGAGCPGGWNFNARVGWMGHLWNFLPNANAIPDVNGTENGRFADCYPDGGTWKAYNCPQ